MRILPGGVLLLLLSLGCGDDDGPRTDAGSRPDGASMDAPGGEDSGAGQDAGGGACGVGGCDDGDDCTVDSCDEEMMICRHAARDGDGDGHGDAACGGDDCDDTDILRYTGATEVCDAMDRDEDCDAATFGVRDLDADTYPDADCCNGSVCGTDCNDTLSGVHPTATETCNTLDDDCDGMTDEMVGMVFYRDADGDGHGVMTDTVMGCTAPAGYVDLGDDCDDTTSARHPGLGEDCDMPLDEDCDGVPDDGCACTGAMTRPCDEAGVCATGTQVCVGGMWSMCSVTPTAGETACDGRDENCNGMTDEGLMIDCWSDPDNDGYAAVGAARSFECPMGASGDRCGTGTTSREPVAGAVDCAPANPARFPGATETCNGADDNCNGTPDEGVMVATYRDQDGDRYGDPMMMRLGCPSDVGYVTSGGDCRDSGPSAADIHPGAPYHDRPYCASSHAACQRADGTWWCRVTSPFMELCDSASALPNWDWDCNGTGDMEPRGTSSCSGTCPDCRGGGLVGTGGVFCGAPATSYFCRCVIPGGCMSTGTADIIMCR